MAMAVPRARRRLRRALQRFVRSGWLLGRAVATIVAGVAGRWNARPGARVRRLRALNRAPLPNLLELYPEARSLPQRELGLRSIPLDEIAGTAVAGQPQRGSDFLPLPPFRSRNWEARWQRVRSALDRLAILPPIEVVLYDGRYWVLDGHNRVAAGLLAGQVEIDAAASELRAPGTASTEPPVPLASVLDEAADLRAAGAGRRSSTVGLSAGESHGGVATLEAAEPAPTDPE